MEKAFCNSEKIDDSIYIPVINEKAAGMKICLNCCASVPGVGMVQHMAKHNRGRGKDPMCGGCNMSLGTNGGSTHRASSHHNQVRRRTASYFCLECGGVFDASTKHPHAEHCFNFGEARAHFGIEVPTLAKKEDKAEMYRGKVDSLAGCALKNNKRDKLAKLEVAIGLGRFVRGQERIVTRTMCMPHLNVHLDTKEGEVAPLCDIVKINPLDERGNEVECEVCKNLNRMFKAGIEKRDLFAAVVRKDDYVRVMYTEQRPVPVLKRIVPLGEADALRKKLGMEQFQQCYTFDPLTLTFVLSQGYEEQMRQKESAAAEKTDDSDEEEEEEEEEQEPGKTEEGEPSAPKAEAPKETPAPQPTRGSGTGKAMYGTSRTKCLKCNRTYSGASCSTCARK